MLNSIFTTNVTILQVLITLAAAAVLGILNAMVFSYKSRMTRSFALTLALLPMISFVIIFLVNDHLGVSVAVAGAFTLVRFRSIKGTGREIVAIFASMAMGLVLGMGYIGLAALLFAAVAVLTIVLTALDFGNGGEEFSVRITIPESLDYAGIFDEIFKKYASSWKLESVRTKNLGTMMELVYGTVFKDGSIPKAFIDEIRTRNGNLNVTVGHEALSEQESM